MEKKNRYLLYSIFYASLLLVAIGIYTYGYNPPTCNPPGCNLPAPINAGPNSQTKEGDLTVKGNLTTGSFTMAAGAEADKVLTTNASGVATWQEAAGGGLWHASGTAAAFDDDVYIGGGLYIQGQRVICPAGQGGTDSFCNNVCTTFYVQTGTEGVESTEYCYNKTALTTANCGAVGGCKASDYTNCNSQSNSTQQYACAQCKYIDTVNCANNVLGSCTNYGTATYCAYNGWNNGATNYHCSSGSCICDSSGYTTAPDGKDNDCDGVIDEYSTEFFCSPSYATNYAITCSYWCTKARGVCVNSCSGSGCGTCTSACTTQMTSLYSCKCSQVRYY